MGDGWLEPCFLWLEWESVDKQEGKDRMNHVVLEYQCEFMFILKYIQMNRYRNN